MEDRFWRWNIPPGSRLEVKVSGAADPTQDRFRASGFFGPGVAKSKPWTEAQLRAGQQENLPQPGTSYVGQIDLDFAAPSPATVEIKVLRPNGSPKGKVYRRTFPGGQGTLSRIHLWLITQAAQAAGGAGGGGA